MREGKAKAEADKQSPLVIADFCRAYPAAVYSIHHMRDRLLLDRIGVTLLTVYECDLAIKRAALNSRLGQIANVVSWRVWLAPRDNVLQTVWVRDGKLGPHQSVARADDARFLASIWLDELLGFLEERVRKQQSFRRKYSRQTAMSLIDIRSIEAIGAVYFLNADEKA